MLKIGIIGSGFGLYGQLPAFNSIPKCRVVCITGKKTPRLLKYCKSINLTKIYTDWNLMLKNEQLDAVALAVPPNIQYQIAKAAINKGLHVFAEKPLAANLKQAKELYALAAKKKVVTAVDFIFPEIPEWQKVKSLLDKEVYGKLKHVSVNWDFESYDIKNKIASWKTDAARGGGALAFYFSHSLYYLEWFAGQIIKLKSLLSHSFESLNGGEVGADLLLKFKKGVSGYAHISANSKGLIRHYLTFICERGTVVLENAKDVTKSFNIKVFSNSREKKIRVNSRRGARKNEDERVMEIKKIAGRFVRACSLRKQMTPSFSHGLRAQKLAEQIKSQQI